MNQVGNLESGKKIYRLLLSLNAVYDIDGYMTVSKHRQQTFANEIVSASLPHHYPPF